MRPASSATRDFSALGLGSLVNGLAAFGIATTATHHYGSAGASAFVDLWTIWLGATAVLTFPVQHWLVLRGARGTPRRMLALLALGAGGAVFVGCAASRQVLFDSPSLAYPLLAASIAAGAVPVGVCRGALIADGRARHTAVILGGENVLRLMAAFAVVAAGGSVAVFSATILVGYAVMATYPYAWSTARGDTPGERVGIRELFRSVGLVGASTLVAQLVLAGGPLLVAASNAPARTVTATFATLEVCGAAYLLALGMSLRFTAILADRRASLSLRRVGCSISAAGALATPVVAAAAAAVGPQVIGALFGKQAELPATSTAFIAAGSVLAVIALLLLLVAVAADRAPHVLAVWVGAAVVGAIWYGALHGPAHLRFAVAFFVVECAAVVGLTAIVAAREPEVSARGGDGLDASPPVPESS